MQSLSSSFSAAKRNPGARKGRRHTVVRISRSADTNTFARCSWLTGTEFRDEGTRFAAHLSATRFQKRLRKPSKNCVDSHAALYTFINNHSVLQVIQLRCRQETRWTHCT